MPEGIAVEVEDGFATIAPSPGKRNDVLTALLATTPSELIEKKTRSGPGVQYRVPEGNARAAGLVDEVSLAGDVLDRADLGAASALADADPNAHGESHWHAPQITVSGNAYVNGRDGANGAISGPLRPNQPTAEAPDRPSVATASAAETQARIKANTPRPASYAPSASVPRPRRSPSGQATIASVVQAVSPVLEQAVASAVEESTRSYDDGKPDADWSRAALNKYARGIGVDPSQYSNKSALLSAIRSFEGA